MQAQAPPQMRGSYSAYRQGSGGVAAGTAPQAPPQAYGQSVGAAVDSMRNMHVTNPPYATSNSHLMPR